MKKMRFIIGLGLLLGLVLTLIRLVFDIDQDTFMHYYWIIGTVMVIFAALIYALRSSKYTTEMNKAVNLLNEGKPEEYIRVVEQLEQKATMRSLKNLLRLNLTAGYCDLEDYDTALYILDSLKNEKLKGEMDLVWRLNKCYCHFCIGESEEAMVQYEENKARFDAAKEKGKHPLNIAILDMFVMIEEGKLKEARQRLKQAKEEWDIPRLYNDYKLIEQRLKEKENK